LLQILATDWQKRLSETKLKMQIELC